ncbi:MAG: hypothetical protein M0042_05250 [Nitrospiraceae bacterium]|nr:hypothetical protein [Nitrospiraceae bacterium]
MASVMNVKESKGYCDDVYARLTVMKDELLKLRSKSAGTGPGEGLDGGSFGRHLTELADQIEWKLQILAHSCSISWKGATDFEETAQISSTVKSDEGEFSPGYVGG